MKWISLAGAALLALAVALSLAASGVALAGTSVNNSSFSVVKGELGVSAGAVVSGFPPGQLIGAPNTSVARPPRPHGRSRAALGRGPFELHFVQRGRDESRRYSRLSGWPRRAVPRGSVAQGGVRLL